VSDHHDVRLTASDRQHSVTGTHICQTFLYPACYVAGSRCVAHFTLCAVVAVKSCLHWKFLSNSTVIFRVMWLIKI